MSSNNSLENVNKIKRIILLFFFLSLLLFVLVISVYSSATKERRLPSLETKKEELAVRGDILSNDNFKLSSSSKIYKAAINTRFLDLDKKELFIQLFSIYSDISSQIIRKKIDDSIKKGKGYLVLSYNIDSKTAKNLKELNFKLRRLDVFKTINVGNTKILTALDVDESGEKRDYSYEDALTPVVGYVKKYESENEKTRLEGVKGLERSYDNSLNSFENGLLEGDRDVLSYITFNKNSTIKNKQDGTSLVLNIPLKLQKSIEMQLDEYKKKYGADEIIVSVMDSTTGKILTLATSNRFSPNHIKQEDIPSLNINAVEYAFEPGSIIKPIAISLVMDKNRVNGNELFFIHNKGKLNSKNEYPKGRYKIGRYTIGDDHRFNKNYINLEDTIIYSSNIASLQIAQRISGQEFKDGFEKFGFTQKSGIDLAYEAIGTIPSVNQLSAGESSKQDNIYKSTVSYGQGMTSTFMQVLKAYSVFNNNGFIVTPQIVSKLYTNNRLVELPQNQQIRVISETSANKMKELLIKTVTKGTGKNANVKGLEIGGKTGTAQIAGKGGYQKKYISSFFGFANDKRNKYTIGVTIINPNTKGQYWYYFYAGQSAAPIFKEIVENLVKLNYLSPST